MGTTAPSNWHIKLTITLAALEAPSCVPSQSSLLPPKVATLLVFSVVLVQVCTPGHFYSFYSTDSLIFFFFSLSNFHWRVQAGDQWSFSVWTSLIACISCCSACLYDAQVSYKLAAGSRGFTYFYGVSTHCTSLWKLKLSIFGWMNESRSVVSSSLQPHGLLQARILEWVAFPFSRGSSQSRDRTQVSHVAGGLFTSWARREVLVDSQGGLPSPFRGQS